MKPLFVILGGIIAVWCLLFLLFITDAISFNHMSNEQCDNVVVLTGGRNRIQHALEAIQTNQPKNIFISGVYAKTTLNDILGNNVNRDRVNFILGKHAKNTFENAEEIDNWVSTNKIEKIILITSDYHMRRSLLVLENVNSGLKVIPCISKSQIDFHFIEICLKEFHKTIYVLFRILINKFTGQRLC